MPVTGINLMFMPMFTKTWMKKRVTTPTASRRPSRSRDSPAVVSVSDTAEYGDYTGGPRIVTEETKAEMKRVLADIQSGRFVKAFVLDNRAGQPELKASRIAAKRHPIEETGAKLRAMMPWIGANKLVDQTKN
jgi:hypothetical protein